MNLVNRLLSNIQMQENEEITHTDTYILQFFPLVHNQQTFELLQCNAVADLDSPCNNSKLHYVPQHKSNFVLSGLQIILKKMSKI